MIEREFIKTKMKNLHIKNKIESIISKNAGIGEIIIEKTPLGEKISIYAVRPGLVIGSGGSTIKQLTQELKTRYKLENPQIEVREIAVPELDATVVARQIAAELENFGIKRFKAIGYRLLDRIIRAGAKGVEIRISGKVPGKRAKTWLFTKSYYPVKKCGDYAVSFIDHSTQIAKTNPGIVGIKVSIMHKDIPLPDTVTLKLETEVKEITGTEAEKEIEEIKKAQEMAEKKEPEVEPKEVKKVEQKEEKDGGTKDKGRKKTIKKGTK